MTEEIIIRPANPKDFNSIKKLLSSEKLPVDDIDTSLKNFFAAIEGNEITGVIGLEVYSEYGLLRSMITNPSYRKKGIAGKLVKRLFEHAQSLKLKEIYLLTETAEKYFANKGFTVVQRDSVPEPVKQSQEFSHACPSTAVAMKKEIMPKKKLLFVCIENSNRSQMSQAFAKIIGGDTIEAYSAGSKPSGIVNPKAVAAMKELGYDLSVHDSKSLQEVEQYAPFDAVVTMGCGDACPRMPAKKFIDWEIPDPKHMEPADFNKVRDYIKGKVGELIESLK
jgi:arsenate reductase (thioredoxin)